MRDVVVGHREDGELRHRAGLVLHDPRALEDRREVGVHVPGVTSAPRHLFARGGDLAQRLAVVRDVRHHHQHVKPVHERQMLGARQARARREQALDGRILRLVQEEDAPFEGAARGEPVEERARLALGDADGDEDHREGLAAGCARVLDDGRGELERGQTGPGEHRKLLSAHQRVHAVDGGDPGLDEITRGQPPHGVERRAVERTERLAERRGLAVARIAHAAERASEQIAPDHRLRELSGEGDVHAGGREAHGLFEDLHDRDLDPDFDDLTAQRGLAWCGQRDPLAQRPRGGASSVIRARDGGHGASAFFGTKAWMRCSSSAARASCSAGGASRNAASARRAGVRSRLTKVAPAASASLPRA